MPTDEAYRSAMVYLAGVGRAANAEGRPDACALAAALSAAAADAGDESEEGAGQALPAQQKACGGGRP